MLILKSASLHQGKEGRGLSMWEKLINSLILVEQKLPKVREGKPKTGIKYKAATGTPACLSVLHRC